MNPRDPFDVLNRHRELQDLRAKATVKSEKQMRIEVLLIERSKWKLLLDEIESEIETIERYRDTGKYDRFAYRQEITPLGLKLNEVKTRIRDIDQEYGRLNNDTESQYLRRLEDWDKRFSDSVQCFSIFVVRFRDEISEHLLLPGNLRDFSPASAPFPISDDSPLGSACLNRFPGEKVQSISPNGRLEDVEIMLTSRADEDILEEICSQVAKMDLPREFRIFVEQSYGGSMQRWRDSARGKDYIRCSRCGTYFVLNGYCSNC